MRIDGYVLEPKPVASTYLSKVYRGAGPDGAPVAVKVNAAGDDGLIRYLQGLDHPNLLTPTRVLSHEGKVVEIMPFLDAPWAHPQVYRGNWPASFARDVLVQVLRGLALLHTHGIAHLDVREKNLFVHRETFETKLFDFNNAAAPYCNLFPVSSWNAIAPEMRLARGEVGYRCDVWQAGNLLREMTHGLGDDLESLSWVPNDDVSQGLLEIIARATAENPAERYADAREFYADLDCL